MIKAVFDTNVFVSAYVIPDSKAEEAFNLARRGKIKLFTSSFILTELAQKLRVKFEWSDEKITGTLKQVSRIAEVVSPKEKLNTLKDEPDNRILECAVEAKANLIITGDKHLLKLKNYEGIGIMRVADLLYTVKEK